MMSKQEERAALAKIEKILAEAGPNSYIGMAFDGCVEIARSNIDNDFGESWKQTAETWMRNAQTEHDLRLRCQDRINELVEDCEKHIAEKDALRDSLKDSKDAALPLELYEQLTQNLQEQIDSVNAQIVNCIDRLDGLADAPYDIAVGNALKVLKVARAKKKQLCALAEDLIKYKWQA